MVFSSMTFVPLFLPLVLILYFTFRSPRARNMVLLLFSLLFYAWGEPKWIFVMLLTVTVNFACGLMIDRSENQAKRTVCMIVGVALSLGFLFYFKYFGFFSDIFFSLVGGENHFQKPVLPIGISFYTFQVLTYTVDVYRRKVPVQKSYMKLLLYVSFFPQLIAGPIVNYTDIAPSLDVRKSEAEDVFQGFLRFFIGFAKKVLLANTCGVVTDKIIGFGQLSVAGSWLMAIAYALQIYFDFSGYSDMAIGMGRMFGFRFFENFNYPYISKSVTEFWRRWHISLGTFFRDYVYIPLGGNRVSLWKNIRNILIVWLLTGFWHGAGWNFLFWGFYYGVLLLIEKFLLRSSLSKLPVFLQRAYTLLLVLIGWIFFACVDFTGAWTYLRVMFSCADGFAATQLLPWLPVCAAGFIASTPLVKRCWNKCTAMNIMPWIEVFLCLVILVLCTANLVSGSYNPFLYFRF